ncbi:MAG: hypothetical protein MUC36_15665 [Planctomycetes bacterium]|jgi:hypothetical protein|nr:hypothetical protein [Planctomycetota bacterium]
MVQRAVLGFLLVLSGVACTAPVPSRPDPTVDLAANELLPILRQWCGDGPATDTAWCAVAGHGDEWRALQSRLGPAGACFGQDFGPAAGTLVMVVAAPTGLHRAATPVRVATEEGVDVLTFTTVADPAPRSPLWVLAVPARPHQLAVVLALPAAGFEVPIEALLQVFAPR